MTVIKVVVVLYLLFSFGVQFIFSLTDPDDSTVLRSLKEEWEYTQSNWGTSDDPCGTPWDGVTCNASRVTALRLSTMGLKGGLNGDIGMLSELRILDLSFNRGLTGPLSPELGNLQKLTTLILAGCNFRGSIPPELGKLGELTFFALNSNYFTGEIPNTLGYLSKVYWLDLADNQISGPIPVSTPTSPGLDLLLKAKHFHFNNNKLSGSIPAKLFSSEMKLIHILFDGNELSGTIPSTLGLIQTLEVLRLDRNSLEGDVPSNLNNLTKVNELNLAHNSLTGPVPDLSGMNDLNYVDLSNNPFDESEAPKWFTAIKSLTTLVMEYSSLQGPVPQELFSAPTMQQVKLKNNSFNAKLSMGDSISQQLQLVDFENNEISTVTLSPEYNKTLALIGNPVCATQLSNTAYCRHQRPVREPYSTSLSHCGDQSCPTDQKLSPQSCECAYPYEGTLYFRGPFFRELSNATTFHVLEMKLWDKLGLTPGSVSLQNLMFNTDDYLQMDLELFPSAGKYFNRSQVIRLGFDLSNQTFKPPPEFGPYFFIALPYAFQVSASSGGARTSTGLIAGIAGACVFLVLVVLGVGIYAAKQKKRAERAISSSRPVVFRGSSGKDGGSAPQLKGARWFPYDELKKCSNNFSERNELGSGGYGKVYRGLLSDGQQIAIKRAKQGSKQDELEFKTKIELLSRVHHNNLVSLLGFCFEHGEQILVYEYMANGSLKESLSGKSGIHLDWKRRLHIALGSANGLAYLHELANPPTIHREVKSTNILLDENLTAKVADFGLCKLVSDSSKSHVSTQLKETEGHAPDLWYETRTRQVGRRTGVPLVRYGYRCRIRTGCAGHHVGTVKEWVARLTTNTEPDCEMAATVTGVAAMVATAAPNVQKNGYLDPEYYMTQQLTEKSDIYSFGVVMLEILTSKQPIKDGKYVVREVRTMINKNDNEFFGLSAIVDPVIKNSSPNQTGFGKFLELAMKCVEESASDRPTMSEVVKEIETILQNEGINTSSTSSPVHDFGVQEDKNLYDDLTRKDGTDGDAFDYSGAVNTSRA